MSRLTKVTDYVIPQFQNGPSGYSQAKKSGIT